MQQPYTLLQFAQMDGYSCLDEFSLRATLACLQVSQSQEPMWGPFTVARNLEESFEHPRDKDRLLPLVAEVVAEGHSVLVFCAGRAQCKSCAGETPSPYRGTPKYFQISEVFISYARALTHF